ncbi:MAG: WecB/TagA/CpsF family glycosyltransferase, partial [Synergistaceae bacterium]|nr:WecB/TagA/CpsF family glycosyltransferase [Synergistaceae bacterium]
YPGLKVVGFHDGYFGKDKENDIIAEIKNTQARLLFVGFGVPRQEYWLYDTLPKIGNVIGMGVGGSMDVLSGELRRAPSLWQRCGMEWFYRLIQEPWRWRRAAKLPVFVFLVLMTRLGIIKKRG